MIKAEYDTHSIYQVVRKEIKDLVIARGLEITPLYDSYDPIDRFNIGKLRDDITWVDKLFKLDKYDCICQCSIMPNYNKERGNFIILLSDVKRPGAASNLSEDFDKHFGDIFEIHLAQKAVDIEQLGTKP